MNRIEDARGGERVTRIEASFGPAASLLLARLVAWLRLTSITSHPTSSLLRALQYFLDDASAPRFIAEFVQMGGIGTLLDILQSPGGSPGHDEDKRRALAVLITLARSGRAHKELMTAPPYSAGDAALALVLRTHDPRAHEHIVELLTELGRDNPRFAPHLLNRTLAVLGSRSAHCACTAAKAVRDLLPEAHPTQRRPGEAEGAGPAPPPPMGALVGAAMGLLHHRDEELLQVTIDLLKVVSQYEGGGATVVSALLPYLSGAHSGASPPRKPGAGAHGGGRDEPRPQATDLLQANATRILAAVAPAACKTDLLVASLLLGEDVIYDLMVPLANFGHRPSQVAAVECVNALMQANGGERVAINLTMATSEEMMAWLLHAKDAPAEALDNCPADIREQLEHGAAAGRAKRGHADQGGRPQGLSIEEALGSALAGDSPGSQPLLSRLASGREGDEHGPSPSSQRDSQGQGQADPSRGQSVSKQAPPSRSRSYSDGAASARASGGGAAAPPVDRRLLALPGKQQGGSIEGREYNVGKVGSPAASPLNSPNAVGVQRRGNVPVSNFGVGAASVGGPRPGVAGAGGGLMGATVRKGGSSSSGGSGGLPMASSSVRA